MQQHAYEELCGTSEGEAEGGAEVEGGGNSPPCGGFKENSNLWSEFPPPSRQLPLSAST